VAESGRKAYAARIDVLKRKLTSDGFSPASTGRLAILCVSALQGALIQARVERSGAPIETAAEELAKMLEKRSSAGFHDSGAGRRAVPPKDPCIEKSDRKATGVIPFICPGFFRRRSRH